MQWASPEPQELILDILIPTYNRRDIVGVNIRWLMTAIRAERLTSHIRIVVSDNCSPDSSYEALLPLMVDNQDVGMVLFRQPQNIGLEPNVIFLLEQAHAPYVMYVGDDDFVPERYLTKVVEILLKDSCVGCICPGFSELHTNGEVLPARVAAFDERVFPPGAMSVLKMSQYGHQLSGVVVKTEGVCAAYLSKTSHRNLYPWIYFVSYWLLRGHRGYYLPAYQVLVSQGNPKEWRYDDSGLLGHVFRNYNALFDQAFILKSLCQTSFMFQQPWRVLGRGMRGVLHLWQAEEPTWMTKIAVVLLLGWRILAITKRYLIRLLVPVRL